MSTEGEPVPVDPSVVVTVDRNTLPGSWISIDATGQATVLDIDKYAIMQRVQIHARDLRILDPDLDYPFTIFCRERAIVFNLEHIKAIITTEEVLLLYSLNTKVISVLEEFQRRLPVVQGDTEAESPFEFRALEVALEAICSLLAARTSELASSAILAVFELISKISHRNLDRIRELKFDMSQLIDRIQKVRDVLEPLLDDDGHMADLYLSRKLAGVSSSVNDSAIPKRHATFTKKDSRIARSKRAGKTDLEELEMLLEKYLMQTDRNLKRVTEIREDVHGVENYLNIQLDSIRNRLIKFELILSCVAICISVYSLVAGILGMNIPFSWNTKAYMFKWVVSGTGTLCAILFGLILSWARYKKLVGSWQLGN